jgi:hypothetical protein
MQIQIFNFNFSEIITTKTFSTSWLCAAEKSPLRGDLEGLFIYLCRPWLKQEQ